MAKMYGKPGEEWGDQKVYEALESLPADYIVYAQPLLVHEEKRREPDYVLVAKELGVMVLEVKDWKHIESVNAREAEVIREKSGRLESVDSPVDQARKAAFVLTDMLKEDEELRNYAGKLDFPYAYCAVLPHQPPLTIQRLEKAWGKTYLLGRDDLKPDRIYGKVKAVHVPFRRMMTETQFRAACAILDDRNKIIDKKTGEFKGVLDSDQEALVKEPPVPEEDTKDGKEKLQDDLFGLNQPSPAAHMQHLEDEMPVEISELKKEMHVRLVRGFAGTGKTDILVLRAQYLHDQYPDIDILVTTFNDPLFKNRLQPELKHLKKRVDVKKFDSLCADLYKRWNGRWDKPQDTGGLVKKLARENPRIDEINPDFIKDEFIWIKEMRRTNREDYINLPREGRGAASGKTLSRKAKSEIFDFYERYNEELDSLSAHDWVDLHDHTLDYLEKGIQPEKRYDVVLIDEAQHFAPTWVKIIQHFVKPGGSIFLCDDPSQSVYRFYSWRQKGIEVSGRTRWLRIPYRNTRQIFKAAFALVAEDGQAQKMLGEEGVRIVPNLDSPCLRNGPKPQVHRFDTVPSERDFIGQEIETVIGQGFKPEDICILHSQRYILEGFKNKFNNKVHVDEARRQTGMEYSAIFIPQVQRLFEREVGKPWEEEQSRQRMQLYMMMTRARSRLYLSYQQKWPKTFDPILEYSELRGLDRK